MDNPRRMTSILSLAIFVAVSLLGAAGQRSSASQMRYFQPGREIGLTSAQSSQEPGIGVRVSEILLPVTVTNHAGEAVLNLGKRDFSVFDNGIKQPIEHFDLGGDPLSIVLVVETSSHIKRFLPAIQKTGIVFGQTVMGQTAQAAVLEFNDSISVVEQFTSEREHVENAIEHLTLGTSGIRLYDAMSQAVARLGEQEPSRRRVMIVMAEAIDKGSDKKLGELLRQAETENVTIYSVNLSTTAASLGEESRPGGPTPIGPEGTFPVPTPGRRPQTPDLEAQMQGNIDLLALAEWLVRTGKNALGPDSLAAATQATGGMSIDTSDERSIVKAMDSIGGEIHAQYMIGFRISGDSVAGYHRIRVDVTRPDLKVRTRPGYFIKSTGS